MLDETYNAAEVMPDIADITRRRAGGDDNQILTVAPQFCEAFEL